MSGTTSVPPPEWTDTGFVAPSDADILAGINADLNAAFGGNLNVGTADGTPTNATPQGQLAASLSAIVSDKDAQFLFYVSQTDPAFASGRMQDAIARIYFITRNPALPTVVTATCTGRVGVPIPAGASARATDGTIYLCQSGGTIPAGGAIDLQFVSTVPGPITCPPNSLNQIYRMIPNWDSINNIAAGVTGRNVESRAEFEARRGASVARNSLGMLSSVVGQVYDVPGTLDVYATENPTNAAVTVGGVSIAAHSLYVAAVGGTDYAVAHAIFSKKPPGCGYVGTTTVVVQDTNSAYTAPLPSYSVKFTRPAPVPILFAVTIVDSVAVPSDAATQVQNAIIDAFSGGDGGPRVRIGGSLYASRFYAPIAALGPWAQIVTVQLGISAPILDQVGVRIDQIPVTSAANITLTLM